MTNATQADVLTRFTKPGGEGPLLVATDGTLQSEAALRAASWLAARLGRAVHVLSVLEAMPAASPDIGILPAPRLTEAVRSEELLSRVEAQVQAVAGRDADWPVEVAHGHAARTIVTAARDRGASLIIMGLGRHRLLDRIAGAETVVQVLRVSTIPVLAVPATFEALPSRAVVGIDFSELGTRAARIGVGLLQSRSSVHLVHVNDGTDDLIDGSMNERALDDAWAAALRAIEAPADLRVRTLTLSGNPGRELLAFARAARADLIVLGTHGRGLLQRLMLGSVANRVVRGVADAAVLIVPTERPAEVPDQPTHGARRDAEDVASFGARLGAFTQRNMGRRCSLEGDDPEFGAQVHSFDYPFAGATYDARSGRVELRFGDLAQDGHHLMRSVAAVTSVDVRLDQHGGDQVLQLGHGRGQTLLTFAR